VVVADAVEGRFGERTTVRVREDPFRGCVLRVGLPESAAAPEIGRTVRFKAVVTSVRERDRPRDDAREGSVGFSRPWSFEVTGWRSGVLGAVYRWRADSAGALARISGDSGALLSGIALGDRRRVRGSQVEADFRTLGLSHALAVSGTHLGIVCGLLLSVVSRVTRRRRAIQVAIVVCAWLFAAMTGFPISAVRACAMLSAMAMSRMLAVRPDSVAALATGAACVLLVQPMAAFDVGFALSVSAVGGLLIFGRLLFEWLAAAVPKGPRAAVRLVSAAVAAQLSTLPVSASAFGAVSLLAPVANAAVLPIIEAALALALGGAALGGWRSLPGRICLTVASAVASTVAKLAAALAAVPGACVAVPPGPAAAAALGFLGVLWLAWPRPAPTRARRVLVVSSLLVAIVAFFEVPVPGVRVVVLDVGQGDAILVESGLQTVLVDTGPDPTSLRTALGRHGVRRVDAVVLTHAHDDHTGGLRGLRGLVRPRWIGVPGVREAQGPLVSVVARALGADAKSRVVGLQQGQRFAVGAATVEVLWPKTDVSGLSSNDTSVVLRVRYREFDAVLTGDAESHVQRELARAELLERIEVLKVPHHGSENG
jgi:competence protein ComEC